MRTVLWCSVRGDKMCRGRLHILSFSGDNVCRVRQNVPLRVHMLSPATNCAGATKCAVTDVFYWAWITRTWRDAWTIYVTHVLDTRSIRARMQSRRRCVVLWLGKYWISRGRNVLLQGNSWRLRFDGLSLRFWQKTNSFATLTRVFLAKPQLESPNLNPHS